MQKSETLPLAIAPPCFYRMVYILYVEQCNDSVQNCKIRCSTFPGMESLRFRGHAQQLVSSPTLRVSSVEEQDRTFAA